MKISKPIFSQIIKYRGKIYFLQFLFSLIASRSLFAQIQITLPAERSVFQRVNNVASIHIGGNIQYAADEVQARIIPIQGGIGTDWKLIDASPKGGIFSGELTYITGGWYRLEVRAIANGNQIGDITSLAKVGVGEVFFIAGQSNAQGGRPPTGGFIDNTYFGATDDRVNGIDYYDSVESSYLPFPKITQIKAATNLAPHGQASWCWALLGDKIAKELNVPVLFFNAAEGATRVSQWAQAAKGEPTYNFITNKQAAQGWPYVFLEKSLHYYASIYGIRAILWHQGEEDAVINTSLADYSSNLETLINKSRVHFGKNISWIVAKVSFSRNGPKESIKTAQQNVIDKAGFNVFQGPDTDLIQPSVSQRDDGVHFRNTGLVQLADAWASSIINGGFLQRSTPYLANPIIKNITSSCTNSQLSISLPTNYKKPVWFINEGSDYQESFNKTLNKNETAYGSIRDDNNNFYLSPPITFSPSNVEIKLERSPIICQGEKLNLLANSQSVDYLWSTGEMTKVISLSKSGNYNISLETKDVYGCLAKANSSFSLQVLTPPLPPIIEAQSATTFCEGGKVQLIVKDNTKYSLLWNNGQSGPNIEVSKSGSFNVLNVDENNCKSNSSNKIEVKVNPLPEKPNISLVGKPQFCSGDSIKLTTNTATKYIWFDGQQENNTSQNQIFVRSGGDSSVKTINEFGCISPISDKLTITKLELPNNPTIEIIGKNLLCAGDSTKISTKSAAKSYNWYSDGGNVEASLTEKLEIFTSKEQAESEKNYKLKLVDENGCLSNFSNTIKVITKALPNTPIIEKIGPYTASAKRPFKTSINYKWFFDNNPMNFEGESIKINKAGSYKSIAMESYIIDNQSLTCLSNFSNELKIDLLTESFFLYPNPIFDGNLYFETKANDSNFSLKLYDPLGQLIKSFDRLDTSKRIQLYLGKLSGLFIAEISFGGNTYRRNIFLKN